MSILGNDELIFDGCSLAVDKEGDILDEGGIFVEDSFIVDLDTKGKPRIKREFNEIKEVHKALVLGVRDYVQKCGFQKVVIGLSGGIDSSVVAAIAAEALGAENVTGISMPTRFSSQASLDDAKELSKRLGIIHKVISIDKTFQNYLDLLSKEFKGRETDTTEENIQARKIDIDNRKTIFFGNSLSK